jgi:hypothetical protein
VPNLVRQQPRMVGQLVGVHAQQDDVADRERGRPRGEQPGAVAQGEDRAVRSGAQPGAAGGRQGQAERRGQRDVVDEAAQKVAAAHPAILPGPPPEWSRSGPAFALPRVEC